MQKQNKELSIDQLSIEITRRCNMSCPHCLRGEAEAIDMNLDYVKILFSKIDCIYSLTLTGGEPSLKPELIREVVKLAGQAGVEIYNFYIATNGKDISDEFLLAILELYCYCSDNEISGVEMSVDEFHSEEFEGEGSEGWERLSAFKFFGSKNKVTWDSLINEGRTLDMGGGSIEREADTILIEEDGATPRIMDASIYLNCEGNLISGCDFSYESQRGEENIICSVEEFGLERVKGFHKAEIED